MKLGSGVGLRLEVDQTFRRLAKSLSCASLIALALACSTASLSQVASYQVVPDTALTVKDAPFATYDGLVRELRRGGYVIYMRHGVVLPNSADTQGPGEWWKNCEQTRRTGPGALPAAQAIGQAIAKQRIAVTEVLSSEFCRAYDTALFVGLRTPERRAALNAVSAFDSQSLSRATFAAGITELLSTPPAQGGNRLLVGHSLPASLVHPMLAFVEEGHTLVFRPEGGSKFHFIAALSPGQWQWIGKQVVDDRAQQSTPATPNAIQAPQVSAVSPAPPAQSPFIEPARELKGADLLTALRKGGYVLYMRHGQANVGNDQDLTKSPTWWEDCTIQRNLSELGREQSSRVGAAIRELKIPIATVLASQFCRVRQTAERMELGPVLVTEDLNHMIGQRHGTNVNDLRFARLQTPPPQGKNVLIVSHTHASPRDAERILGGIQEAEIVVFAQEGERVFPVARIPIADWDLLRAAAAPPNAAR
ncbi:MAG: histidine phosphatase family protein [Burkholderiales bacterium]|nr:histidine phosphatase family protein [Nitrosomonadaceae bacterium]